MSTDEMLRQRGAAPPIDDAVVDDEVRQIVDRHPTVGLAIGVVDVNGGWSFHGHGVADIESKSPITESTVFRIASITKTFTAIAIMQLCERGLIDLDAAANDYLRSYELVPGDAGFPPATVRHLLTHTAGLPEIARVHRLIRPDFGESWPRGSQLPSLTEFYRGRIRLDAKPGTRFVYNNHGPATLGQIVEDVTGDGLADYFHDHIFGPLGMVDTDLRSTERLERRRATGYEIGGRGVRKVARRDMVTAGAASAQSTPADMARYLRAVLGRGTNEHGSVLERETMASMFEAHYRPDPRFPGMGLGFFRTAIGAQVAVGHQGTYPGFHSQVLAAVEPGFAAMGFTNGAHQPDLWLPSAVSSVLRRVAAIPEREPAHPSHPEVWEDVSGWYRLSSRLTDVRLRGAFGLGAEVFVRGAKLMLRFLTPIPDMAAGFDLLADDDEDPYVYRADLSDFGLERLGVAFEQDRRGVTTRMHLDLMPLSLDKQPATTNPRRWAAGGLAIGTAALLAARLRR